MVKGPHFLHLRHSLAFQGKLHRPADFFPPSMAIPPAILYHYINIYININI